MEIVDAISALTEAYKRNGNKLPVELVESLKGVKEKKEKPVMKAREASELKRAAKIIAQKVMYGNHH